MNILKIPTTSITGLLARSDAGILLNKLGGLVGFSLQLESDLKKLVLDGGIVCIEGIRKKGRDKILNFSLK